MTSQVLGSLYVLAACFNTWFIVLKCLDSAKAAL